MKPVLIVFEDGHRDTGMIIYDNPDTAATMAEEIAEMDSKEGMPYTISHNLADFTEEEISKITAEAYEFYNFSKMSDLAEKMYELLWERIENSTNRKSATIDLYTLLTSYLIEE